jgi:phenylacetate-CoA ligase
VDVGRAVRPLTVAAHGRRYESLEGSDIGSTARGSSVAPTAHVSATLGGPLRSATVGGLLRATWLFPLDVAFRVLGLRFAWLRALFTSGPPVMLEFLGRLRAERAAFRAIRRVPAYRRLMQERGIRAEEAWPLGILDTLPETDKRSYIDRYPLEDRCVDGHFPFAGTTIDESSGSTGRPYDWIRGRRERGIAQRNIGFFTRYILGDAPLVTINAFSMGAWAAGINTHQGMNRHGVVKSTGPDLDKVFSTLRLLGPGYRYAICGYPPFLKHLLDIGESEGFPWDQYELHGLVGGEGMAEGLRDYLLGHFRSVYSGYGATDLEVGMAAESPVSVAVRRIARADEGVRAALFGDRSRLPMVFQYNPLIHYLEVNADAEVVATVSRLDLLAPRIRYNVHDEGGVASFRRVRAMLRDRGYDLMHLGRHPAAHGPRGPLPWAAPVPLPFLWIYGRRDFTISIMGANIYPEDVESAIYGEPEVAATVRSFQLTVVQDETGNPRPGVLLELAEGVTVDDAWRTDRALHIRDAVAALNRDYRTSLDEFPEAMLPLVETFASGAGPFAGDAERIKQRRIAAD